MSGMDFSEHLIISAAGSAAILAAGAGLDSAAAFSLAGVFVDLDHLVDYWRETGINARVPHFMKYFSKRMPRRLVLPLHAWEWIALAAAAAWLSGAPAWAGYAIAGWLIHLILDQRFNRLHRLAYFFSFRAAQGFKAKSLYERKS